MKGKWRPGKRVAVIGAGPGGVSTAIAMHKQGYDVRLYERNPEPKPLGGGVLLSTPVLAILRYYGIDLADFGSFTRTYFRNNKGKLRSRLPFYEDIEKALGIPGWFYGMLRSNAFGKMLEKLPDGILVPGHDFKSYEEKDDDIIVRFESGPEVVADILVGADGIRSKVSTQTFGDPQLFHVGLRVWLAWCRQFEGVPPETGVLHHSRNVQASYFPMMHDGKPGFEWWIVEAVTEPDKAPSNVEAHVRSLLADFVDPMPRFPDHTDFETQIFRWDVYNRPSLKKWTKGRLAFVGDSVHPVSPYAAYGMGMAIEDGYFLARALGGRDLNDRGGIDAAFARYNDERVDYVNEFVEFARTLGYRFHKAPAAVAWLRDMVFDHTGFLHWALLKQNRTNAERITDQLKELHVV